LYPEDGGSIALEAQKAVSIIVTAMRTADPNIVVLQ
jgi:hypothetical protein